MRARKKPAWDQLSRPSPSMRRPIRLTGQIPMGGLLGKWRREISDQPGRYWAHNDVPTNGGENIHCIIFTCSNSIRIASFVMNT